MRSLWQDLRYGFRLLVKSPGFTTAAVLTLALGIGASTATFSVVKGALIDPWPYEGADRIVTVNGVFPRMGVQSNSLWSVAEFRDLRERTDVFDYVIAGIGRTANLVQEGYPERIVGAAMTADAFSMLGVNPILGRVFLPEEDRPGAPRVVVMSYALWMRNFGGSRDIVGKAIRLDDELYTVVGVMPRDFLWWGSELWFPLSPDFSQIDRSHRTIVIQGRLRRGIAPRAAEGALASSTREMTRQFGAEVPEYEGFQIHLRPLRDEVLRNVRESLLILLGAVGFLLLVASANVANLLLAKAAGRQREIAVRMALGADQKTIVRQLLTESVLLATIGGLAGCALAYASTNIVVSLIPYGYIPAEAHVRLSIGVLFFALGLSFGTGLLFGLAPAFQVFDTDIHQALKQGGHKTIGNVSGRRMRNVFAVAEVALAFVVICGAVALMKSFRNLEHEDLGFRPEHVVTMRIGLPASRYASETQVTHFFQELLRQVREIPGVESGALATDLPLGPILNSGVTIDGTSAATLGRVPDADYAAVSPEYFSTLSIPVISGRPITRQDSSNSARIAVINQTMAKEFWPNQDALGKRFKLGRLDSNLPWMTVVGVVGDVKQISVQLGPRQAFFVPFTQDASDSQAMTLIVRSEAETAVVVHAVRDRVMQLDRELPIYRLETLEKRLTDSLGGEKLAASMLSCLAAIVFVLSVVGIFGVISYSVSQRINEFGLRMALGAEPGTILKLVITDATKLSLMGMMLGSVASYLLIRVISSLLYGVNPTDVLTLLGVGMILGVTTIFASLIPARRAMHVDPNVALRSE
jgi:predicted permease